MLTPSAAFEEGGGWMRFFGPIWFACAVATLAPAHADSVTTGDNVEEEISVRAFPALTGKVIGALKKDESASMLGATRYWRKVRLDDGTVGYVRRSWSRLVPEELDSEQLVVSFIDVGQGDAILMQLGSVDVMIDAGPRGSWGKGLDSALGGVDGALEFLFITHPHEDHYGGARDVLSKLAVKTLHTNGECRGPPRDKEELKSWTEFEDAVSREGIEISALKVGQEISPAPGLSLTVLATGDRRGGEFSDTAAGTDINNDSLVMMVEYAGRRILLTGDLENAAESMLLERHCPADAPCERLHADVLKVPHHGSASFEPAFFSVVGASWAVISAGSKSAKHHLPRAKAVDALRALGTKVISTSSEGDESIMLMVAADGRLRWKKPGSSFSAWDEQGSKFISRVYEQGK